MDQGGKVPRRVHDEGHCRSDRIRSTRRKSASACALARLEVRVRGLDGRQEGPGASKRKKRGGKRGGGDAWRRSTTTKDHVDVDLAVARSNGFHGEGPWRSEGRRKPTMDPIDGSEHASDDRKRADARWDPRSNTRRRKGKKNADVRVLANGCDDEDGCGGGTGTRSRAGSRGAWTLRIGSNGLAGGTCEGLGAKLTAGRARAWDETTRDAMRMAKQVGYSFVCQYYTVLHNSAQFLYQFYNEQSSLTVAEADSTNAAVVQGQQAIHQKVVELGYVDAKVEIMSVDSQYSLGGGVLVTVTGMITRKGSDRRAFAQSFFLAVQEKGYYVLNDIIRFLPESVELKSEGSANDIPNGETEDNQEPVPAAPVPAAPVPPEEEAVPEVVAEQEQAPVHEAEEGPAADEMPAEVKEDENAPKTYASILQRMKAAAAAAAAKEAPVAKKQVKPVPVPAPAPVSAQDPTAQVESSTAEPPPTAPPMPAVEKAPVLSVFVRNIPPTMDENDIERAFSAYGKIRNGRRGISLKVQKGSSYAFVDFETPEMVRAAIAATIEMGGRTLQVEEKKPVIFKKNGAGPTAGRGRHGSMGGGRGGRGGRGTGGRGSNNNGHAANKVGPAPAATRV